MVLLVGCCFWRAAGYFIDWRLIRLAGCFVHDAGDHPLVFNDALFLNVPQALTGTVPDCLFDAVSDADVEYELLTDAELLVGPVTLPDALLVNVSLALTDTVPDCVLDGVSDADDEYELLTDVTDAELLVEPVTLKLPDALRVNVSQAFVRTS